jgi:hypothetical protein
VVSTTTSVSDLSNTYFFIIEAPVTPLPYSTSFDDGAFGWEFIDTGGYVGLDSVEGNAAPPSLKVSKDWVAGLSQGQKYFAPVSSGSVLAEANIKVSTSNWAYMNLYSSTGGLATYLRFANNLMQYYDRNDLQYHNLDGLQACRRVCGIEWR